MRLEIFGLILIIIGIIFIALSATGGKFAFVGFIGPIPFGFGNDTKLIKTVLIISIIIILIIMIAFGVYHG